jgi:hypothetical protein
MATANDLIARAMRLIGAIDPNQALEANMAQDALDTLNAMLAEWHEAGIGLPEYQLTSLFDTLSTDNADREAISYQLALRIAPEYGLAPSELVFRQAMESFYRLRSRYFTASHPIPSTYY